MTRNIKIKISLLAFLVFFLIGSFVNAQTINIDVTKLLSHTEISFSPRSGSFVEGSTFEVPILLNTKNRSINGIEVRVNFDKNKLSIINQTGGTSIIGVWVEPPRFDNTEGTASYVGVVPNGIITGAGLVGTITFKAKTPGNAIVSFNSNSKVLLNDGLGTETQVDLGRANYTILTKAPEGVQIFSETHPVQLDWYNNNTPVLSWIKDPGVAGFSFVLDDKPNTIPDNIIGTQETTKTFEKLPDGLWYFHIKANKGGMWGTTGHFLMRIDTAPPAEFKPEINFLVAAAILTDRTLVSFFTTDNLSGIDHYEVGVIDKNQPPTESPVFVQAESPFQVPLNTGGKLQVIVRAIDKAGNVRDESIDVQVPFVITKFIQDYLVYILIGIILLGLVILILHYLVGHHIIRYIGRIRQILKKEKIEEAEKILLQENDNIPQKPQL
jgi:Cohesin domain